MKRFRRVITVVIVLLLFSAVAYGDTWTTNKMITDTLGDSKYPATAVDGSKIYVVWQDNTPDLSNQEIYFKRSVDGGTNWKMDKRLTNNAGGNYNSYDPAIAVDGSNIYVVWWDTRPGNYEIYFKRSVDGGVTWKNDRRLTNNAGYSQYPAIAVDGSNIYVVWHDYTPGIPEIYFKRSVDGGVTWKTDKRLTNNAGYSFFPAIAVDGSSIYVVWEDNTPGNYEIYFKRSVDGGVTWKTDKRLTNNAGVSYDPAIAVDGQNIYVVWYDDTPGNEEIYFKKSDDGGVTWKTDKRLTNNAGVSYDPAIAVDGSNICVVWYDETPGNYEIYFKKSDDEGATWTTKRLTNDALGSMHPAIAADGSNVYIVWQNFISMPPNYEIYFKRGVLD
ncbi:MAG: hypothetical protein A2Y81_09505 [Nitrospirae bacterium RBG_13_43_8]|nr:MAG: hypothetical protein A2Y81_09505 [Nitrospirae bacterium RBG_13_43_8]